MAASLRSPSANSFRPMRPPCDKTVYGSLSASAVPTGGKSGCDAVPLGGQVPITMGVQRSLPTSTLPLMVPPLSTGVFIHSHFPVSLSRYFTLVPLTTLSWVMLTVTEPPEMPVTLTSKKVGPFSPWSGVPVGGLSRNCAFTVMGTP